MNLSFVPESIRFHFSLKKHTAHIPTHTFEGVGNFETKGYMPIDRKVTWGKAKIQIKN